VDRPAQPGSTLAEEARLLAAAQAALRDGAVDDALRSLDEHARRFTDGAMRAERESLRAIVLCKSDRVDEGARLARALIAAQTAVPYASRLRTACSVE
jgi:hypothetical protein